MFIGSLANKKYKRICEGSGRGLIKSLSQLFRGGTVVNYGKFRQDDRNPDLYSNRDPPNKYLESWHYTNLNDQDGCEERYIYTVT
jgi:hypothetical protein